MMAEVDARNAPSVGVSAEVDTTGLTEVDRFQRANEAVLSAQVVASLDRLGIESGYSHDSCGHTQITRYTAITGV